MARILAMDTSGGACSVALLRVDPAGEAEVVHRHQWVERGHTGLLLPMVDELLSLENIRLTQLDALALGHGPGSFTGLRISAGVVQGLAFGADLPVVTVSSLAAIARAALVEQPEKHRNRALVCVDARMGEVYFGVYDGVVDPGAAGSVHGVEVVAVGGGDILVASGAVDLQSWLEPEARHLALGSGWKLMINSAGDEAFSEVNTDAVAHAVDVAWLGLSAWSRGATLMPHQVEPSYLRDRVAWQRAKT